MDIEGYRKAGYAAVDAICDYYSTLPSRPVKSEVKPGFLVNTLSDEVPEDGEDFAMITKDFNKMVIPGITHWQHPQFTAYFPSISTFESMIGEMYTSAVSNPGFNWICSPACTELEQVTVDMCARLLGLSTEFLNSSKKGGGIISGTASEVALTVAIAAREKALRIIASQETGSNGFPNGSSTPINNTTGAVPGSDVPIVVREKYGMKLVMYGSTQTHSLGAKAAALLGVQWRAVDVSVKDDYALRGDALKAAVEVDLAKGLVPFCVIGTVGTTSSGAVDRIAEIGEVCKAYPTMFFHVDAAWAGVGYALPSQRGLLRLDEVNQYADAFCTNMHKQGLVGFDCSLLCVRDRQDLISAMTLTPTYLRSKEGDAGTVVDYRNWQLFLGRRFRSPKLWFVLRAFGVSGFQKHLQGGIDRCQVLAKRIEASSSFELVTPPSFSLLTFRIKTTGQTATPDQLNDLNDQFSARLDARSDVFLTPTSLVSLESKINCLRISTGSYRTTLEDVMAVWEVVEREGQAHLVDWEQSTVQ